LGRGTRFAPLRCAVRLHSGVRKPEKASPTESPLRFQIDPEPAPESLTALGGMPCARFGANAAWLRLAALTHNVLTALKRLALPPKLLAARPKRLRFLIFNTPGRIVHHARQVLLRLAATKERIDEWIEAMALLPVLVAGSGS